jgi:hypothetical protein
VDDLRGWRAVVVPHGAPLRGRPAVWAFRRGNACVISVPRPMVGPLAPLAKRHSPAEWFEAQFLRDVLRHPVDRVVGPVSLGVGADAGPCWQTTRPGQQAAPGFREYATYFVAFLKPTWP